MESRALEQVQGYEGLGHQAIPEVKREVIVHAAKTSNEIVLERANSALGRVAAMDVGRHELEIDLFVPEKFFPDCRALVVEALEFGPQSDLAEFGMEGLEDSENGLSSPGLHAVAVIII